jgi:hypothetical protein
MHKTPYLFLFVSLLLSAPSSAQDDPFTCIQNLFSAISAVDHEKMTDLVTSDFQLLENGEVWDIDDLIEAVSLSDLERRNYFHVIKTAVSGNSAWVSYWNKATFSRDERVRTVAWLESAVLTRKDDSWQVQMLHSTRIEPGKLPPDIELAEHRN